LAKKGWATFWAIISQAHLVALAESIKNEEDQLESGLFAGKRLARMMADAARGTHLSGQADFRSNSKLVEKN
jgi:hypothetical protein